ncbi:MAG: hypothetical protein Q9195_001904 [Heterodermia aff. obscurata]
MPLEYFPASPNWSTSATDGSSPPSSPPHSRPSSTTPSSMEFEPPSPTWSTAATAGSSPPPSSRLRCRSSLDLAKLPSPSSSMAPPQMLTRQRESLSVRPRESSWFEVLTWLFVPRPASLQHMVEKDAQFVASEVLGDDGKETERSVHEEEGSGIEKLAQGGERDHQSVIKDEEEDVVVGSCATDKTEAPQTGFEGENVMKKESEEHVRLVDADVPGNDPEAVVVVKKEEKKLHARWDLSPSPRTRTCGTARSKSLAGAEDSPRNEKEDSGSRTWNGAHLVENRRRTRRIGVVEANRMCLHSYIKRV